MLMIVTIYDVLGVAFIVLLVVVGVYAFRVSRSVADALFKLLDEMGKGGDGDGKGGGDKRPKA